MSVGTVVGYYYNLVGGFWSQYWSQSNAANQYKYIDQYQIQDNSSSNLWAWREMYANGLSDLQYVINTTQAKENWSIYLMATVMQAYGWQVMVDFMDKVPYIEAFQGDASTPNFSPKYDNGQDIYEHLFVRIDTAMSQPFNTLSDAEEKGDLMYKGDINNWIKFLNTLKLKMYMRMMYANPSAAQAGVEKLYADGAEFISDVTDEAKLDVFIDQENKDNPLYGNNNRKLNVATNLRISATLFRYLEQNDDPRLAGYAGAGTRCHRVVSIFPRHSWLRPPLLFLIFTQPIRFILFQPSNPSFSRLKQLPRGWGTGDAKALYDEAITLSFDRYGEDASSFLAPGGAYEYPATGTFEDQQKAIMMAKWAALAGTEGLEMFFETNRTHYPGISAVPSWEGGAYNPDYVGGLLTYSLEGVTSGEFPKGFVYPQQEVNLNTNFPGQRTVTTKVWWDTK